MTGNAVSRSRKQTLGGGTLQKKVRADMTTFIPERGPDGKIIVGGGPLDALYQDTRQALGGAMATEAPPAPARPVIRPVLSGRAQLVLAGGAGLLLVFALSYLIGARAPSTVPGTTTPAPAPSAVATPPAPTVAPLPPSIVAFAAPGGDVLGPIDARQAYHFVGRYGDGWLQANVPGSGRVWVRRADLQLDRDNLAAIAALPDLTPPTPLPPPPPT